MPAKPLMGWEPRQKLWRKTYKKKPYTISCKQLSDWSGKPVPETENGSYQTANAWWQVKLTELASQPATLTGPSLPAETIAYLNVLDQRRAWAVEQSGQEGKDVADFVGWEMQRIRSGGNPLKFMPLDYPFREPTVTDK